MHVLSIFRGKQGQMSQNSMYGLKTEVYFRSKDSNAPNSPDILKDTSFMRSYPPKPTKHEENGPKSKI